MPWHIESDNDECSSGYAVVVDATGEVVGCHDTRQDALDHLAALNANVEHAVEEADMETKQFLIGTVKAFEEPQHPNGTFEVILSMPTLDRDGEFVDARAFEPLPESIPFHAFHDFHDPIGRAVPYYDGDVLKARGYFGSTPRAQEIRALVADGVIGHTSVGFMRTPLVKDAEGRPHLTKGELLEGSFASVVSCREASVLTAKAFEDLRTKVGARNSTGDSGRLQQIHDLSVENGAVCKAADHGETKIVAPDGVDEPAAADPEKAAAPAAAKTPDAAAGMARLAALAAEADLLLLG